MARLRTTLRSHWRDSLAPTDQRAAAAPRHEAARERISLGWLPAISLSAAAGLLIVSVAHTGARADAPWAETAFWAGLLTLILPILLRLIGEDALRIERVGLVALLGVSLYLTKYFHSPYAFTFPDELHHVYNVDSIFSTGHLFAENSFLPVTPYYPGLANLTTALIALTGMSTFSAGLVVIGVARLALSLALFLFYERLSGSARVAGIGAALYMANANFLFWSAQYSYESLALPIGVVLLYALAEREAAQERRPAAALTVGMLALSAAVITSHHMTSYAIVGFLWAASTVAVALARRGHVPPAAVWRLLRITVIFSIAALAWLFLVADLTIGYLSPVLLGAVTSVVKLMLGEEAGARQLFTSSSGYVAPLWERVVGLGSVALLLVGLPFGLLPAWRFHRRTVLVVVLALAALAYFPLLALRFTSAGWETSNRAAAFLYLGIAFTVAVGVAHSCRGRRSHWAVRLALALCGLVIFFGGAIAGWPPSARLGRTYLVDAGGAVIGPPGVAVARWTRERLGSGNRIATDPSNGKLLFAYGGQDAYAGKRYGVEAMLKANQVARTEQEILRFIRIRYVLLDRREVAWDHLIGNYFSHTDPASRQSTTYEEAYIFEKFDRQGVASRLLDAGDIVLYDVGAISDVPPER